MYAITVGSEALYRGSLTALQLLAKIQDMHTTFPGVKIGTADSWNKYADGTADELIKGDVKLLWANSISKLIIRRLIITRLVNAFGYWQGQDIKNATATYLDDLMQAFVHIQELAGSLDNIELWNGETGWPTTGLIYD